MQNKKVCLAGKFQKIQDRMVEIENAMVFTPDMPVTKMIALHDEQSKLFQIQAWINQLGAVHDKKIIETVDNGGIVGANGMRVVN